MPRCCRHDNARLNKMAANTYELRLAPDKKFSAPVARECLKDVLMSEFDDKIYDSSQVAKWTQEISQTICERLQELGFERYKYVVQVVIGEQRGEGSRMACRCLWDSDTDVCVSEFYNGDSLFCAAVVLASYYY